MTRRLSGTLARLRRLERFRATCLPGPLPIVVAVAWVALAIALVSSSMAHRARLWERANLEAAESAQASEDTHR